MIYRGPGFFAVVLFDSSPPVLHVSSTGEDRKRDNLLTEEGGGVGEEPNHKSARKLGPLYIIQYSLYTVQYTSINVTSVPSQKTLVYTCASKYNL
jgi:hypothetical protein